MLRCNDISFEENRAPLSLIFKFVDHEVAEGIDHPLGHDISNILFVNRRDAMCPRWQGNYWIKWRIPLICGVNVIPIPPHANAQAEVKGV